MHFRIARGILLASLVLAVGCASSKHSAWEGPTTLAPSTHQPWTYQDHPGQTIQTEHYAIHTTIDKQEFLDRLTQVMEGGHAQYEKFAPTPDPANPQPLQCFMFRSRPEWATFTSQNTGADAEIYLKINRGGYTIRDWFVAYLTSDVGSFAVAAHEGWHQYVSRNFKSRLPPFLEEGIATQFESIRWDGPLPRWNLDYHPMRVQRLRQACDDKYLWPLDKLVAMHAGDVVGLQGEKIEAFYAQNWAFARFLWEADGGKYRPAFQKLLQDAAAGTLYQPSPQPHRPFYVFQPQSVAPMLEHYLGMPMPQIEQEYLKYVHQLAYERFNEQWQAK